MSSSTLLMGSPPRGSHLRIYQAILRHPLSHNLGWRDAQPLLGQLGQVEEEANGNLKVTRNGQTLVLHPPRANEGARMDELMALRDFLERSETPAKTLPPAEQEAHWLLVIDGHSARIFRSEMDGTAPRQILPHEPEDYFRMALRSDDSSKDVAKPAPNCFFEPVARALKAAGRILIFGTGRGRGTSNEMDQFVAWARLHHPEMASRIIGSLVVDEHNLDQGPLLAKAREFYANSQTACA